MEELQSVELFARADVFDRYPGHFSQRQGRSTTGVAIHLRQDDPGQVDVRLETLGDMDSLLASHRVGYQQSLVRTDASSDRLQLTHELIVDLQAASGVDDDEAQTVLFGILQRGLRQLRWLLVGIV